MKTVVYTILLMLCGALSACPLDAQSIPAATQALHLSAFGGATGTFTGLESGRNLGITAGVDLTARSFYSFYPSLEVRGTYPFANGQIDSQRNILGGLKIERPFGRFRLYGDILYGRGSIDYENGGLPDTAHVFQYKESPSNVLSAGGGTDYRLSDSFALKAEVQFQRYATPVTLSGHLYAKPFTAGVVYRFNFNRASHGRR